MTDPRPIEILLVEDNPDDIELTLAALEDSKIENRPHVARDGIEAMEFLHGKGQFEGAPRPDIVFLDLNMPRKSGREVLEEMKKDESLCTIPVIVLTTSQADEDILRSYKLQAAAYVNKPVDFDQFVQAVRAIDQFWFRVVVYPNKATKKLAA